MKFHRRVQYSQAVGKRGAVERGTTSTAMAGWLHGVCVGACWVVSPQGGFSLSLFCN